MKTRTFRFWTFWRRGYVKLTLRPGQSLTARYYQQDDEGYSSGAATWSHEETGVQCYSGSRSRDCDGTYSDSRKCFAPGDRLAVEPAYLDRDLRDLPEGTRLSFYDRQRLDMVHFEGRRILHPEWQDVDSEFRDYAAEAAGY